MTDNNCGISLAYLVAFDLCFAGGRPPSPLWSPRLYSLDDDAVPLLQLRETPDDEEVIPMMSQSQMKATPPFPVV